MSSRAGRGELRVKKGNALLLFTRTASTSWDRKSDNLGSASGGSFAAARTRHRHAAGKPVLSSLTHCLVAALAGWGNGSESALGAGVPRFLAAGWRKIARDEALVRAKVGRCAWALIWCLLTRLFQCWRGVWGGNLCPQRKSVCKKIYTPHSRTRFTLHCMATTQITVRFVIGPVSSGPFYPGLEAVSL